MGWFILISQVADAVEPHTFVSRKYRVWYQSPLGSETFTADHHLCDAQNSPQPSKPKMEPSMPAPQRICRSTEELCTLIRTQSSIPSPPDPASLIKARHTRRGLCTFAEVTLQVVAYISPCAQAQRLSIEIPPTSGGDTVYGGDSGVRKRREQEQRWCGNT